MLHLRSVADDEAVHIHHLIHLGHLTHVPLSILNYAYALFLPSTTLFVACSLPWPLPSTTAYIVYVMYVHCALVYRVYTSI